MLSAKGVAIVENGKLYVATEKGGGYWLEGDFCYKTGDIVWLHFDHKGNPSGVEPLSAHLEHDVPEIPDDPVVETDIEDYHKDDGNWGEWE